jgi:hypothetical protein
VEKRMSALETNIFGLKMMMKSGLESINLRFHYLLQSCCCPMEKNLARKAGSAWLVEFQNIFFRPIVIIIFKPKMLVSIPEILVHLF